MHEWINDSLLQFCRQDFELSWDLPQLRTLPPALLSFQTDWTWFPEDPWTYLYMSLLVPGNSSFHFWIHILGCRRKSSFQDCYGTSNALGNFWNWHIHSHLLSRNKTPGQGPWSSENRTLQTRDSPHLAPPDTRPISRLSHSL